MKKIIPGYEDFINENKIEEGVLTIAGGVALGIAAVWIVSKGGKWLLQKVGNGLDDLEQWADKKKSDSEYKKLIDKLTPVADKLSKDNVLMGMYKELPPFSFKTTKTAKADNKERTKGLLKINKYIKEKLTDEEMKNFSTISKLLRNQIN